MLSERDAARDECRRLASALRASGEELAFSAFRGKVVYVQNVASR